MWLKINKTNVVYTPLHLCPHNLSKVFGHLYIDYSLSYTTESWKVETELPKAVQDQLVGHEFR
jgi:hypothetical protein